MTCPACDHEMEPIPFAGYVCLDEDCEAEDRED
jgi:hypothetical protein